MPTGATSDAAAYRVADADLVAILAAHITAPDAVQAADTAVQAAATAGADADDHPGSALRGAS